MALMRLTGKVRKRSNAERSQYIARDAAAFKGSLNNQFSISGIEAPACAKRSAAGRPAWQGVETEEYQAYFEFPQHSQAGWIDVCNVELFLGAP